MAKEGFAIHDVVRTAARGAARIGRISVSRVCGSYPSKAGSSLATA